MKIQNTHTSANTAAFGLRKFLLVVPLCLLAFAGKGFAQANCVCTLNNHMRWQVQIYVVDPATGDDKQQIGVVGSGRSNRFAVPFGTRLRAKYGTQTMWEGVVPREATVVGNIGDPPAAPAAPAVEPLGANAETATRVVFTGDSGRKYRIDKFDGKWWVVHPQAKVQDVFYDQVNLQRGRNAIMLVYNLKDFERKHFGHSVEIILIDFDNRIVKKANSWGPVDDFGIIEGRWRKDVFNIVSAE